MTPPQKKKAPAFVMKADTHSSFNREVGKTDIPAFAEPTYTIPVSTGVGSIEIELPDFTAAGIGDYWYEIEERTMEGTAGITNDTVNPKYLHVQVVWSDNTHTFAIVGSTTIHSTAPEANGAYINDAGDKVTGFVNSYGAGDITVTKEAEGNMSDPNKLFKVTVSFTAPAGKTVMSDIAYSGGFTDETGATAVDDIIAKNWADSRSVDVYLKDGATVTFTNIPDGVTYEIVEADYSADGYVASYAIDSDATAEANDVAATDKVNGTISDSMDKVTITNTKDVAIDVGVILDNAPFILLLATSVVLFAVYFVTKRRKEEESY